MFMNTSPEGMDLNKKLNAEAGVKEETKEEIPPTPMEPGSA